MEEKTIYLMADKNQTKEYAGRQERHIQGLLSTDPVPSASHFLCSTTTFL